MTTLTNIVTSRTALLTALAGLALAAPAVAGSDFNGDGIQDLAIGVPGEGVGNIAGAGMVQVFYGGTNGLQLTAPADQVFHQDTANVLETAEALDQFGKVLATGDFNGDGFDDLAIGVPNEDLVSGGTNRADAGVVQILYGSAQGLRTTGNQLFKQGSGGLTGAITEDNQFGHALAAGDFDRDGFWDLAIGIPNQKVGTASGAGAVQIVYGSANGLNAARSTLITQNSTGILDTAETNDGFGFALAACDFSDDGYCDLAIGVPFEDVVIGGVNVANCGMVQVIYGTPAGLTDVDEVWVQGQNGLAGAAQVNDRFGRSLAAGRRAKTKGVASAAFLAVGVPADADSPSLSGSVAVIKSSPDQLLKMSLRSSGNVLIHQDIVAGFAAASSADGFGSALAIADFGANDGIAATLDLAIGAPGAKIQVNGLPVTGAGAVFVIYDLGGDVNPDKVQVWAQGSASGLADAFEKDDNFGAALAAANFGKTSHADLVIGVPGEDTNLSNVGAIQVVYGTNGGLSATGNQFFTQNTTNVEDSCEAGDLFGAALGR